MPRRKGRGEGKWRSLKTGRYVSAHYGKRNPNRVAREEPGKREEKMVVERQEVPTNMGELNLNDELALKVLATLAWYECGDRRAISSSTYVYFEDIRKVHDKVDVRFEHFLYEDETQGIRVVMRPKVSADELPNTKLDEG